jgi:hypothetical protein
MLGALKQNEPAIEAFLSLFACEIVISRTIQNANQTISLDCRDCDIDCRCGRPKNWAAPVTLIEQAFDFLGSSA